MTEFGALRLILGLRLRAARNQVGGLVVTGVPDKPSDGRGRRGRALPRGSAVGVGIALLALAVTFAMSKAVFDSAAIYAVASGRVARVFASQAAASRACAEGVAFFLAWAQLALVCLGLGYRDPHRLGTRIESLLPLPVPLRVAFAAEVLERAALNPLLWVSVFPLLTVAAWHWGWGTYAAPAVAAPLALLHGLTVGALEFAVAITVRQRLAPEHSGKVRALALGLGTLSPVLLQAFLIRLLEARHSGGEGGVLVDVIGAAGGVALAGPPGLGLLALQGAPGALPASLTALASSAAAWGLALLLLDRLTRRGLDLLTTRSERSRRRSLSLQLFRWLPAGPAEELLALSRDLPALTLNVLVPITVIVANVFLTPAGQGGGSGAGAVAVLVASLITAAAASTLPRMGRSIWVLFTLPRALDRLVIERAAVWGLLGLVAGLAALHALTAGGLGAPEATPAVWSLLVGAPTLTVACAALSLLGARPFAAEPRQLDAEAAVNQFLLVGALAASSVLEPGLRFRLLVFLVAIAMGLWQRAVLHAPRLLDPAVAGPRPIDVADGMKGVVAFFALQVTLVMGLKEVPWLQGPGGRAIGIGIAFAMAGAMAIGLTVDPLVKQGLRLREVIPLWRGRASVLPLAGGLLGGLCTFGLALGYLALLQQQLGFAIPYEWAPPVTEALRHPVLGIALAVVAAPVVEEILFRGLLFVGLRQALGVPSAILLSALVFALVHHDLSFGAVFAGGAACAWIYQRTGLLSAAMLAHALHNGLGVTTGGL